MNRKNKCFIIAFSILWVSSCSTTNKKNEEDKFIAKTCVSDECEVEKYELFLKELGTSESDLKNGNSFKALKRLEEIKEQAYYHGRFKSLYQLAQESCFKSTNELSKKTNACSLVRERVFFIKAVSPDNLSRVSTAISNCNIDISKNATSFDFSKVSKNIELNNKEIQESNVYEEAIKIQQHYNSNPWEDLLLIDLKTFANYKLILGRPILQKETPIGFVRLKIPLDVKSNGKVSYCSQYKDFIHNEDLSGSVSCYDYPDLSDHMDGIFSSGSAKPQRWTESSYLTTLKISKSSQKYVRELPFTKNYKNGLALDIRYGSGKTLTIIPSLSYPGELIHSLMGRLARMAKGGEPVRPNVPEVYIAGRASNGISFKIVKRESTITDLWGGYDMDIIIPLEMAKDIESFRLYIPIQKIWDFYHDLSQTREPISGAIYGE